MSDLDRVPPIEIYDRIMSVLPMAILEELIDDQQLAHDGWQIHYAVDHYEVSNFCFPINVEKLGEYCDSEIEEISRSQNARHELFYAQRWKPIALSIYDEELGGLIRFVSQPDRAYRPAEIIERYVRESRLTEDDFNLTTNDQTADFVMRNMNNVLAIALCLRSIGVHRLHELFKSKLSYNRFAFDSGLGLDFDTIPASRDCLLIRQILDGKYPSARLSNKRDAAAIDRVIQINRILAEQKKNALLLYMSSTDRTAYLTADTQIVGILPVVRGRVYNIFRSTKHLFAYLLMVGGGTNPQERAKSLIDNARQRMQLLVKAKGISEGLRLRKMEGQCRACPQDESVRLKCIYSDICDGLQHFQRSLETKRRHLNNLSLIRAIDDFVRVLGTQDIDASQRHRYFVQFVLNITGRTKELLLAELNTLVELIGTRLELGSILPAIVTRPRSGPRARATTSLQQFPIRLKLRSQEMRAIEKLLTDFTVLWDMAEDDRYRMLAKAVGRILEIDAQFKEDPEVELLRCVLFLCCDDSRLSEEAYGRALDLSNKYAEYRKEFSYVAAFAAKNRGRYQDAVEICGRELKRDESDARFYHVRALAVWTWLGDEKVESRPNFGFRDLIGDTNNAIRFYEDAGDYEMVAVNLNNIAYLYAQPKDETFDLDAAEESFTWIEKMIPREDWEKRFPEFIDTEATILFERAKQARRAGSEEKASKLVAKSTELEKKAFGVFNKEIYFQKIDEMERFAKGEQAR